MTIEQALEKAGYGHKSLPYGTRADGRSEIYRIADGKVIGYYSAVESLELIRKRPHVRGFQSLTRIEA
jgi:hypothetical protein